MENRLETLLSPVIAGLGFELGKAESNGRNMRVFIDKESGVSVDDCARVSDHLTRLFDVERIEFGRLEVSSPGLDRELVKPSDFVRFAGQKARLKLKNPLAGRRNFTGVLRESNEGGLTLDVEGTQVSIAFENIAKARLAPETPERSKP
ncbi:MAG: ribosome maturation factor RimP [Burkholderiales bacterium]